MAEWIPDLHNDGVRGLARIVAHDDLFARRVVGIVLLLLFGQQLLPGPDREKLTYDQMMTQVDEGKVAELTVNNSTLSITGKFTADASGMQAGQTPRQASRMFAR